MPTSSVSTFNVEEASGGNQALRNTLQYLSSQISQQKQVTATSNKPAPSQQPATVAFQNPLFIVTFTSQQASSTQQASQQAAIGTNSTQSVIYNQVRVANSLLFDAASNIETYGGDQGNPQSQFVISDLDPSKGWFFQVRSSYDGNSWNQWKTINDGKPVDESSNGVSLLPVPGGSYASFILPGSQSVSIGVMTIFDQGVIAPGPGATIQRSFGIAGPNGYTDTGHPAHGINAGGIDVNGIVSMNYADGSGNQWSGTANCLVFGWASDGQNVTATPVTGGNFTVFTLAGGAQFAIGSGVIASGSAFGLPPGFSAANSMAICAPANTGDSRGNSAHGIAAASVTGTTPTISYTDGSNDAWSGDAQWFCICWAAPLQANVKTVTGGQYLILHTPSGDIAVGMGSVDSAGIIPLPEGYAFNAGQNIQTAIAFVSPASYVEAGHNMHGVELCSVDANGMTILIYEDGEGNQWSGGTNWFCMAWNPTT